MSEHSSEKWLHISLVTGSCTFHDNNKGHRIYIMVTLIVVCQRIERSCVFEQNQQQKCFHQLNCSHSTSTFFGYSTQGSYAIHIESCNKRLFFKSIESVFSSLVMMAAFKSKIPGTMFEIGQHMEVKLEWTGNFWNLIGLMTRAHQVKCISLTGTTNWGPFCICILSAQLRD